MLQLSPNDMRIVRILAGSAGIVAIALIFVIDAYARRHPNMPISSRAIAQGTRLFAVLIVLGAVAAMFLR